MSAAPFLAPSHEYWLKLWSWRVPVADISAIFHFELVVVVGEPPHAARTSGTSVMAAASGNLRMTIETLLYGCWRLPVYDRICLTLARRYCARSHALATGAC